MAKSSAADTRTPTDSELKAPRLRNQARRGHPLTYPEDHVVHNAGVSMRARRGMGKKSKKLVNL